MKRKKKIAVVLLVFLGVMIGGIVIMNIDKFAAFYTTLLTPNILWILIAALILTPVFFIIFKVVSAGTFKFDWWIFGKIAKREKFLERDKAREKSKQTLEQEYILVTGLTQIHKRELSLVADMVVDTEPGRKPFAVFFWTTLGFSGRRHNLEQIIKDHFDQLFIVEVNLSNGYCSVLPWDAKETLEWLKWKHMMSKTKEEDPTMKAMKEKFFEGAGIGAGQKAVEKTEEKKEEVKESDER